MPERHRRAGLGAVDIAGTANVEECPLRDVARPGYEGRVGPQEVGLVEGRGGRYAGQDDEEGQDQRSRQEDEGHKAQ